ncbi:MAG: gluconeogenesis factor YvcK family protein [Chloroflexota bacterium]
MLRRWHTIQKWLTPGLGIKRWLILLIIGLTAGSIALAQLIVELYREQELPGFVYYITLRFLPIPLRIVVGLAIGIGIIVVAILELNRSILSPFARQQHFIDLMYSYSFRNKGIKVVALGGGTGLPAVLRGLKHDTGNIIAIVTVADDGGSSGKLRRELGVLPPGDLRNNIVALADDENLMTQLFQYRFGEGGLEGHSFGNLFITALADITGSMDRALIEAGRVLAIRGRVLPSTLQDVTLVGEVRQPGSTTLKRVVGESQIPMVGGVIERVSLSPESARAYPESTRAILSADLIVIGPGSLYTSIVPNLLVEGIPQAIRASGALCLYVCNIATQDGETDNYTVADHVLALERHAGRRLFSIVIANNAYPPSDETAYVMPAPQDHDIWQRYTIYETDLTDNKYPWRHSPEKLGRAILNIVAQHQSTTLPFSETR